MLILFMHKSLKEIGCPFSKMDTETPSRCVCCDNALCHSVCVSSLSGFVLVFLCVRCRCL